MNYNRGKNQLQDSSQYRTDTNKSGREANYIDSRRFQNQPGNRQTQNSYQPNEDLDKSGSDNRGEAVYYYEPDKNGMSPVTEGRQANANVNVHATRSPTSTFVRQSVLRSVKMDLHDRGDIGRSTIQQLQIQIPMKSGEPGLEASPKTIYLGQENIYDLNTRTRDKRGSPNYQQAYLMDHETNTYKKNFEDKMSPNKNSNEYVSHYPEEGKVDDKKGKIENLKKLYDLVYPNNNTIEDERESDHKGENDNIYKNYGKEFERFSMMQGNNKPIVFDTDTRKKYAGFNKHKKEGKLVTRNVESIRPALDSFNDRTAVGQKFNRLSTIILSRSLEPKNSRQAKNEDEEYEAHKTLRDMKDIERRAFAMTKSPQQKFIRITMAMLSSKGPNCEDRVITRVMRQDKGGVVDLAHSTHKVKKFEIKKVNQKRSPVKGKERSPRNMKDRLVAAKLVQKWWRDILGKYRALTHKLVKLQSVWRGYWVRQNLYDILYYMILSQAVMDKIKPPVVNSVQKFVFPELRDRFADQWRLRINFEKFLKLQRTAKEFVARLRDKKVKLAMCFERLIHKNRTNSFNAIRKYADIYDIKKQRILNLLEATKKQMRHNIFHDTAIKLHKVPVDRLKSQLRRKILKNKVENLHFFNLHDPFMRWFQVTRPKKITDNMKYAMFKLIGKVIKRNIFNDLLRGLKKLPPKGLKEKLIRRFLSRKADVYANIILKEYLRRWLKIATHLQVEEFKTTVFDRFLYRTQKKIMKNRFRDAFRLWHRMIFKNLDLAKVTEFNDALRKTLQKHAFRVARPKIWECSQGIIGRTIDEILRRLTPKRFVLRIHFNKWRKTALKLQLIETQTKTLVLMKKLGGERNYIKAVSGAFADWRRKTQIEIYLNRFEEKESEERKKLRAALNMVYAIKRYGRKEAFKSFYPQLIKFLTHIIKKEALKKMAETNPIILRLLMRMYLRRWKDVKTYLAEKEFRNKIFDKLAEKSQSRIRKNLLRAYLRLWEKNKPKNPLARYAKGCDLLRNHCLRLGIWDIYDALKKKFQRLIEEEERRRKDRASQLLMRVRTRLMNGFYKGCFDLWRLKMLNLKHRDDRNLVWSKLLGSNLRKIWLRSLAKRFGLWRANKKAFKWEELEQLLRGVDRAANAIRKSSNRQNFPQFLEKCKKYKSNPYLQRFHDKLKNASDKSDFFKKKYYLRLWKNILKKLQTDDLKAKIFGFALNGKDIKDNKNGLLRALRLWNKNADLDKLSDEARKNAAITKGVEHLNKPILMRKNFFFNRIKKVLKLDPRGRMILAVEKRLSKPRYSLSRAFDFWRRIELLQKMRKKEQELINLFLFGQCKKLADRHRGDILLKRFKLWRANLKKPDDYYDKICRGVKKLNSACINKYLNLPFMNIRDSKDYAKLFEKMFPKSYQLRKNKERLRNRFAKWWRYCIEQRKKDWAIKLLANFKEGQLKRLKSNLMSRYWRKFAGYRPKSLHYPDVRQGGDLINNYLINKQLKEFPKLLAKRADDRDKKKATDRFLDSMKIIHRKKFHRAFIKWYRNAMRDDSDLRSKVLRNFKRIIIENYFSTPLEKYFRRWLRKMIVKPLDLRIVEDATNKVKNAFKSNLCREPFNKIRNHISPQYLQKALLEKILPKSRLKVAKLQRDALLLWKNKVQEMKIKFLKAKTIGILYEKDRSKVLHYFLNRYFKLWRANSRITNLSKIIDGENKLFKLFVNKYLAPDFIKDAKNYAKLKFLRKSFEGSNKYQLRAIRPFFIEWIAKARFLKAQELKHAFWAKIMTGIKKGHAKKDAQDVLRNRLRLWKNKAQKITKKIRDDTEKGADKLRKTALKSNYPHVIKKIDEEATRNKQKKALGKAYDVAEHLINLILKRKLRLWEVKARKIAVKEFKIRAMEGNMKLLQNKFNRNWLARNFLLWKAYALRKNHNAIAVAVLTLKRLLTRGPWYDFKKICETLNVKAPYGMTLAQVLLKKGRFAGKLFIFRNLNIRPNWRLWKLKVKEIQAKELQDKLVRKVLFRKEDQNYRLILRNYLRIWKSKKDQIELKELRDQTTGRLYKTIYGNNLNILKRRCLRLWKKNYDDYIKRLNDITLAATKLDHFDKRRNLADLLRKINYHKELQRKKDLAKRVWRIALNNIDRGKLLLAYFHWKKRLYDYRILKLKHTIIKNLVSGNEKDQALKTYLRLKEAFLKWRILSNPRGVYDKLSRIRIGTEKLMIHLRNRFNPEIHAEMKRRALLHKIKEILLKLASQYDDAAKLELLRIKFKYWRALREDRLRKRRKLKEMINRHIDTKAKDDLTSKPISMLLESVNKLKSQRNNNCILIQRFFRNLFKDININKVGTVAKNLRCSFEKSDQKKGRRLLNYFKLWKKNANYLKVEQASGKIKGFLKSGRNNKNSKNDKTKKFVFLTWKFMKHRILDKIKKRAKDNYLKQLLAKCMKQIPPELRLDFLRRYLLKWRKINNHYKTQKAGFLLTTITKGFLAKKFIRDLLKKKLFFNKLLMNLFGKHLNMMRLWFKKWNLTSRVMKMDESAKVIQNYIGKKLNNFKRREALENIKALLRGYAWMNIKDAIKKAARVNKNSAAVLYKTLREIYYERPFEKLKRELLWIGKMKKLRYVYPLLVEKFRLYWLPYYLRKWNKKVKDQTLKHAIQLQNFIRGRLLLWKEKARVRKENLISKYALKMTKDHKLMMKIAFKNWWNRIKSLKLQKAVVNVQKIWQGNTSRKNVDRQVAQFKLKNLFRKLAIRNLNNQFVQLADYTEPLKNFLTKLRNPFENRYATNNLLDLSRNYIRNNFLSRLTGKLAYKDYLTSLRRYWELWHKNLFGLGKLALKIQTNYRRFLALKALKFKLRLRDAIYKCLLAAEKNAKTKLEIAYKLWKNITQAALLEKNAKIIQGYVKRKNDKWRWTKFVSLFDDLAHKLTTKRVNEGLKVNKLKDTLQKIYLKKLLDLIKLREKMRKITWFFLKHLGLSDARYRLIFLQKYLVEWNERAKKLNILRNKAATKIQNNFRRWTLEKWLRRERQKKIRALKIIDKLTDLNEIRLKVKLRLWKAVIDEEKLKQSARQISGFFADVRNKHRRIRIKKRLDEIKEGLALLEKGTTKKYTRQPFNEIKEEASGNKLKKFVKLLQDKRNDHLKTPFDKIKELADYNRKLRDECAHRLQKKWKLFWYKKGIWGIISKIRKMRFMLSLMANKNLRFLNKAYKLWRKNAMGDIWFSSAKIIQDFCQENVLKKLQRKRREAKEKARKLLRGNFLKTKLTPFARDFRYAKCIFPAGEHIKRHIFQKFRYNIFNFEKLKLMWKLFRLPKSCINKMLRHRLLLWKVQAEKIAKNRASEKVTKNIRLYNLRRKMKKLKDTMTKRLIELAFKNSDLKRYYLLKWASNTIADRINDAAKKINDFVKENWERIKAKKKWKYLTDRLHNKRMLKSGLNLLDRYKKFRGLDKLFNVLDHKIKRDGFDDLKKNSRLNGIWKLIYGVFNDFENRDKLLKKKHFLRLWKAKKDKLVKRDEALERLHEITDTLAKINAAKAVGDASICKRLKILFDTVDKVKAMKQLKSKAGFVEKMKRFKNLLNKSQQDLADNNKANILDKLFKIYTYKLLDKLHNAYNNVVENVVKPSYGQFFIDQLNENKLHGSKFTDTIQRSGLQEVQPDVFAFQGKSVSRNAKRAQLENKKGHVFHIMPYFVDFLEKKIKERKQWATDKLKKMRRAKALTDALKGFALLKEKEEFVQNLRDCADNERRNLQQKKNLGRILRAHVLNQLKINLTPASRYLRLVYACRVGLLHSDLSDKRFSMELIRKWHFHAKMQKLAKIKMAALYKNMHAQFLNASTEIFGNGGGAGEGEGLFGEFSETAEKLGAFKNEGASGAYNLKKLFVKGQKRFYDFGKVELVFQEEEYPELENAKSHRSGKSGKDYEILDDEGDDTFTQGREDQNTYKKGKEDTYKKGKEDTYKKGKN